MAIFDLFSKRQKKLRGDVPDVYTYDDIPEGLRNQIIHIWIDALGEDHPMHPSKSEQTYQQIAKVLCREYGLSTLPGTKSYNRLSFFDDLSHFFLSENDAERVLDVIELTFKFINQITRQWEYLHRSNAAQIADSAIHELNARFKENGVGYQFSGNEIIRIDSELIHSEVVKPALRLLNKKEYAGVQEEFLKAHEHYRHGNEKESLVECLKAFESMMKSICDKRGWAYDKKDTAKILIDICLKNNLIPSFWQQQFTSIRVLLESSVPTGRNNLGGHGQGSQPIAVPDYLVAYMLHMTASALVFLGEAEAALR